MTREELSNGIKVNFINNPKTPRIGLSFIIPFGRLENKPGVMSLITRLLLQGTKKRTAEQIATELDENGIELQSELKNDYLRLRMQCLNDDFEYALEILSDIIQNSTFDNSGKEASKLKGELVAELDSAKAQAQDNYYMTIFGNHPYGIGPNRILKVIDNIQKEEIISKYSELINSTHKNICVVGDIEQNKVRELLEKHFSLLKDSKQNSFSDEIYELKENKVSTVVKEDANQAQIYQGWILPPIGCEDYHKFMLLNNILGAGGMTSRLFYELREKKGLAYVVRSIFESNRLASCFTVYIATEPKNIKTSIEGFKTEIEKIQNVLLTDEELENAKNNFLGRRQFYYETNFLEATVRGVQDLHCFPENYEEELYGKIDKITPEELMECAKKYFNTPTALSVLAPSKYLDEVNLEQLIDNNTK